MCPKPTYRADENKVAEKPKIKLVDLVISRCFIPSYGTIGVSYDVLEKKQENGGEEEEARDGAGGGSDEVANEHMGGTWMVDLTGGEGMGSELGKEVVEDREAVVVLAVEGEEGRRGRGCGRRPAATLVASQGSKLRKKKNKSRRRREEEGDDRAFGF